ELTQSLRHVLAINLPASAGLAFLGVHIIQLIFEYGEFTPSDTHATAMALAMYAIGLAAYSGVKVLVPACYALGSSRIPVALSMLSVAANILLNLLMIEPFGYWGLALGTSITSFLNALLLLGGVRFLLRKKGGTLPLLPLLRGLVVH